MFGYIWFFFTSTLFLAAGCDAIKTSWPATWPVLAVEHFSTIFSKCFLSSNYINNILIKQNLKPQGGKKQWHTKNSTYLLSVASVQADFHHLDWSWDNSLVFFSVDVVPFPHLYVFFYYDNWKNLVCQLLASTVTQINCKNQGNIALKQPETLNVSTRKQILVSL